jgi:metallo-beta-lactamase family protein
MLKWLSKLSVNPKRVFITHGETESAEQFSRLLRENKGYQTLVPEYGQTVNLE